MSDRDVSLVILTLSVLLASAHYLGYIFERLGQPRLVGEILSGIIVGPFVLGKLFPTIASALFNDGAQGTNTTIILGFLYRLGLMLLMFISGSQVRRVFSQENCRVTAWILGVGTPLRFFVVFALGLLSWISVDAIIGTANQKMAALLIFAIAVAVTSIPVISRIFYDLKILHTRFASLILGVAVLEDIILWGVLAIATALVKSTAFHGQQIAGHIAFHISITMLYVLTALFVAPYFLKKMHSSKWNVFLKSSAIGYIILILFVYTVIAALLNVNLVFSAFLAGFGVVGGMGGLERDRFSKAFESIEHFSTSTFIPLYFSLVGYRLVFGIDFSMTMFFSFLIGSSILTIGAVGIAARCAKFRGLDLLNIAITSNARGGPGIVLASVAYDAGIINAPFYTTLVLSAVLTSQAAGAWLRFVLMKGWPLLSGEGKIFTISNQECGQYLEGNLCEKV